jgi:hypothetical protein
VNRADKRAAAKQKPATESMVTGVVLAPYPPIVIRVAVARLVTVTEWLPLMAPLLAVAETTVASELLAAELLNVEGV